MRKNIIYRTLISVALVTLFLSYYAGATLFSHTHQYAWGKVTHSHPYLPSAGHSHTTAALQTIDSLSNLLFSLTAGLVVALFLNSIERIFAPAIERCFFVSILYVSLRAPPVGY